MDPALADAIEKLEQISRPSKLKPNDQFGSSQAEIYELSMGFDQFCVLLKPANARASIEDMKGAIAMMLLDAQTNKTNPVIVGLVVEKLSLRLVAQLSAYLRSFSDEVGLFLCARDGENSHLDVPRLGFHVQEISSQISIENHFSEYNRRAFTDLNRWLLKVLMLSDSPPGMWPEGQWRQRISSPAELARCAGVSSTKAYQFARTFKKLQWLRWTRGEFEITNRARLFEQWFQEEKQILYELIPVRPLLPRSFEDVYKGLDGVSCAVGGLAACGFHGVQHVVGGLPEVHIFDSAESIIQAARLEVCELHQAELFLRRGPNRESIERGAVVVNGVRVVDILQAALDVSHLPLRGEEQAEHIIRGVLGWER